ncbi:MAG: inositol monophosphatase [Actinomycetota bacterium]
MDALHIVDLFGAIADDVRTAIGALEDWGPSGRRAGQYNVDLAADEVVLQRLRAEGFGVLSEESGLTDPDRPILVVVDPIDGSTNAAAGLPWFATSLCALDEDGPLAARVVNLATGDDWQAIRGEGATRNGHQIEPSSTADLSESLVAVSGLPHEHFGWAQFRCYGAAALDICSVADGSFDGFVDLSVDAHGVWDYVGALLVLREAGGTIVDWHDRDLVTRDHAERRTPIAANSEALLVQLRDSAAGQHDA